MFLNLFFEIVCGWDSRKLNEMAKIIPHLCSPDKVQVSGLEIQKNKLSWTKKNLCPFPQSIISMCTVLLNTLKINTMFLHYTGIPFSVLFCFSVNKWLPFISLFTEIWHILIFCLVFKSTLFMFMHNHSKSICRSIETFL